MGSYTLKVLLEEGISPDTVGDQGETCLHRAAASGLIGIMGQLIAAGGNVNAQDSIGRTPLMRACAGKHLEAVSNLIAAQSELALKDQEGLPALSWASSQNHKILHKLLGCGVPVDSVDLAGRTALFHACLTEDRLTVQMLLDHGARIDTKNNSELFYKKTAVTLPPGCTPLMAAALMNHPVLINTLASANLEEKDSGKGRTSLLLAAEKGNYEAFQTLVSKGSLLTAKNSSRQSVLELAASGGNVKILEYLINLHKIELKTSKQPLFSSEEFKRAIHTGRFGEALPKSMLATLKKLSLPGDKYYEGVELGDPHERLFS